MGSPDEQERKNHNTLFESSELSDASDVRISKNKLCTKENSNKKIKENFRGRKREPPVVDGTFHDNVFLIHLLQKYPHTRTLNNFLMMS